MVIVAVSILAVCLALTYSVWASRPYEALLATYATFAVWLLALLVWSELRPGFATGPSFLHFTEFLRFTNPVWLLGRSEWEPAAASPLRVQVSSSRA